MKVGRCRTTRTAGGCLLDIPYKTHLSMLRDAFDKAATKGLLGMKVPGGRSLVAANLPKGYELWPEADLIERAAKTHEAACKRAGILDSRHLIAYRSDDKVARYATMPPWAIYPLPPAVCAGLITDMAVFIVTISKGPLLSALRGLVSLPAGCCHPTWKTWSSIIAVRKAFSVYISESFADTAGHRE